MTPRIWPVIAKIVVFGFSSTFQLLAVLYVLVFKYERSLSEVLWRLQPTFLIFYCIGILLIVCVCCIKFSKHRFLIDVFGTKASALRRDRPLNRNNDEWVCGMHSHLHCLVVLCNVGINNGADRTKMLKPQKVCRVVTHISSEQDIENTWILNEGPSLSADQYI